MSCTHMRYCKYLRDLFEMAIISLPLIFVFHRVTRKLISANSTDIEHNVRR